jgi:hypothetical protein
MQDCKTEIGAAPAATADGAAVLEPVPAGRSGRGLKGKIARLPHSVREEINQRLRDGRPGLEILAWLNSLPLVRETLQTHFDGSPVSEMNLSYWRHGGYAGWLENQHGKEALLIAAAAGRGIDQADREGLNNHVAFALTARMVLEMRKFDELPEGPLKSAAWKELVWSLTLLRRGEFYAGKLRLEQAKLEAHQKTGNLMSSTAIRWAWAGRTGIISRNVGKAKARPK